MTANFNETYWLLEHDFRLMCVNDQQYYNLSTGHKCIYVKSLGPNDKRGCSRDKYVCHINRATGQGDIIFSGTIDFGSSEWITAAGVNPKNAINNTITDGLSDPKMQHKEELRTFSLMLNPIIWFIKNCINTLTNK